MSTAVMSTLMFEAGEHIFQNASQSKPKEQANHAPLRRSYTSLVTLIEQHRKLDRSVSEPTSRYKTELCRPFEENGACKYGDKCQFAHGYMELRNLARHPKYKTELCRTFHTIGFCPYGPRCHFIHNFEEARIHNQKVSAQLGSTQPNIMGLSPILAGGTHAAHAAHAAHHAAHAAHAAHHAAHAAQGSVNAGLLEQIAPPQAQAQAAAPLMRTASLSLAGTAGAGSAPYNPPLLRANSLSLAPSHGHPQSQVVGARPKPLNLSPTFSLGSTADSVSPSSSLSQSPTNSMASFFNDENVPTTPFSFGQDFGLLARQSPSPQGGVCSPISDDLSPRTPSPLSPNAESRLPVFNRISSTLGDFENLKI
ncbi:protein TIS11 isoform X2 [Orussus abietinus]|uniref:protein TIS11 isoform X2 n=1 Tax=Orussus abietinus TaxID=222816 RepID=UPI00062500F4|nr:protein TIS11 isoform X2 [Orussus abietinus]